MHRRIPMVHNLLSHLVLDEDEPNPVLAERRTHAAMAAVLFFVFSTLFGLWHSLLPLGILLNVVWSLALGAPIGYAISRYGPDPVRGGLIAAGSVFVIAVVRAVVAGANVGSALLPLAILALVGGLPGVFLGWYAQQSRAIQRNLP